jgi:hypothetical protein
MDDQKGLTPPAPTRKPHRLPTIRRNWSTGSSQREIGERRMAFANHATGAHIERGKQGRRPVPSARAPRAVGASARPARCDRAVEFAISVNA